MRVGERERETARREGLRESRDCITASIHYYTRKHIFAQRTKSMRSRSSKEKKKNVALHARASERARTLVDSIIPRIAAQWRKRHVQPQDFRSINSTFDSWRRSRRGGIRSLVNGVTTSPFFPALRRAAAKRALPLTRLSPRHRCPSATLRRKRSKHIDLA